MRHKDVAPEINVLADRVLTHCIRVHRELGPGLKEKFYRRCLAIEFELEELPFEEHASRDVFYRDRRLRNALEIDLLVDGRLVVELKAKEQLHREDFLQTRSYARLGKFPLAILVNFHGARLVDGWHRILPGAHPNTSAVPATSEPPHRNGT